MEHAQAKKRGGAPVGHMSDLDPIEAAAVLYLRMWSDGQIGQDRMTRDFETAFGTAAGRDAMSAFDALCSHCARYGRRPLMRHALTCSCLGADECCFANLIALAGEGEREDAALVASLIVRPDLALGVADLAQEVALNFRRMVASAGLTHNKTLH